MKILIVDSSFAISQRLEEYIADINYTFEFCHASSEKNAMISIAERVPSVVILDLNLPDKHAFRLIKYLKKNHVNTFIIALTNQPDENMRKRCQAMGAGVFLDKYHEFEKVPGIMKEIYQHWCAETENLEQTGS